MALYEYPGYGQSHGHPSEESFYQALKAVSQDLVDRGVPTTDQIAVGWSIGGAVTLGVASDPAFAGFKGAVLMNTFTSMPNVIRHMFARGWDDIAWAKIQGRLQTRFESVNHIENIHCPVAIVSAEEDKRFPQTLRFSDTLFEAANQAIHRWRTSVPEADHSDITTSAYVDALNAAIAQVITASAGTKA